MPFPLCLALSLVAPRRPPGFWQRPRPTCCEAAAWCPKDGLAEAAATAAGGGGRGGSGSLVPSPRRVRRAPQRSLCPWTCLCSGAAGDRLGDSALLSGATRRWFLVLKPLTTSLSLPDRAALPPHPQPPDVPPDLALSLTQGVPRPPAPALPPSFSAPSSHSAPGPLRGRPFEKPLWRSEWTRAGELSEGEAARELGRDDGFLLRQR